MKLKELKLKLKEVDTVIFQLPDGSLVPSHFHITEVGKISKHFIDCGGVFRHEKAANFQLWEADDYEHRLTPRKLLNIIEFSEDILSISNLDIEIEYQSDTIGKYGLDFDGKYFLLTVKKTNCLAKDKCGVSENKPKLELAGLDTQDKYCSPESDCC